jgi:hypothetical protein
MKKTLLSIIAVAIMSPSFAQWTNGTPDISNTNTGNVGIGTTSPQTRLQVSGTISTIDFGNTLNSSNPIITGSIMGGVLYMGGVGKSCC